MLTHTGDPERDAVGLLRASWAPDFPDLPAPVDPIYIARGLGIEVFVGVLDEGVSGMLVKRPGLDPVIYLNRLESQNRQRFTCAHEIGHYVKRASRDDESFEYVDARGPSASQGSDPDEIYANGFAAALLMPREAVDRLVKQGVTVGEMAYRFGVSLEAMNYRLANIRTSP
ncbi:MAG: hypothetical protein QOG15_1631 [Solirubrobacteraceae bacterium]|jgi:hypothetical protein|nr:hypothetical protein [Solirubrobacteraceae bacterium]